MNKSVRQFARFDINVISSENGNDEDIPLPYNSVLKCVTTTSSVVNIENVIDERTKRRINLFFTGNKCGERIAHDGALIVSTPILRHSFQLLPTQECRDCMSSSAET